MGQCLQREYVPNGGMEPDDPSESSGWKAKAEALAAENDELRRQLAERTPSSSSSDSKKEPDLQPIWPLQAWKILQQGLYRVESLLPPMRNYKIDGVPVEAIVPDQDSYYHVTLMQTKVSHLITMTSMQHFYPAFDPGQFLAMIGEIELLEAKCLHNSSKANSPSGEAIDDAKPSHKDVELINPAYHDYLLQDRVHELEYAMTEREVVKCVGISGTSCPKHVIPSLRNMHGNIRCPACSTLYIRSKEIAAAKGNPIIQILPSSGEKATTFKVGELGEENLPAKQADANKQELITSIGEPTTLRCEDILDLSTGTETFDENPCAKTSAKASMSVTTATVKPPSENTLIKEF